MAIIALGTNDLKAKYRRTARDIADDLLWYGQITAELQDIEGGRPSQVLYIAPENHPEAEQGVWAELVEIMQCFDVPMLELGDLGKGPDGLHFSESAHTRVAHMVKDKIEEIKL